MSRLFTTHDNHLLTVSPSLKRQSPLEPLPEADLVLAGDSAKSTQVSAATSHRHPCVVPSDDTQPGETLRCLLSFFAFSRVIGMCPVSRKGNVILIRNQLHPSWYFTWFAISVKITLWINHAYRSFPLKKITGSLVYTINGFLYYTFILANCLYMTWKVKQLPRLIQNFNNVDEMVQSYQIEKRKSTSLVRHSFLLILFFITADFSGHVIFNVADGKIIGVVVFQFFRL